MFWGKVLEGNISSHMFQKKIFSKYVAIYAWNNLICNRMTGPEINSKDLHFRL